MRAGANLLPSDCLAAVPAAWPGLLVRVAHRFHQMGWIQENTLDEARKAAEAEILRKKKK